MTCGREFGNSNRTRECRIWKNNSKDGPVDDSERSLDLDTLRKLTAYVDAF